MNERFEGSSLNAVPLIFKVIRKPTIAIEVCITPVSPSFRAARSVGRASSMMKMIVLITCKKIELRNMHINHVFYLTEHGKVVDKS